MYTVKSLEIAISLYKKIEKNSSDFYDFPPFEL